MKQTVILTLFLVATLGALTVNAQKMGYVNMQDIVTNMPEFAKADSTIGKYNEDLQQQVQTMQGEFQANADKYVQDSLTMSDAVKEVKRSELQDQQNRIMRFQQDLRQKVAQKQQDLLQPIIEKAQQAVDAIAKEKGYDWIFNDTGDGTVLLAKPSGSDLTGDVKAKLGIN